MTNERYLAEARRIAPRELDDLARAQLERAACQRLSGADLGRERDRQLRLSRSLQRLVQALPNELQGSEAVNAIVAALAQDSLPQPRLH